eukprot:TRINITY_DN1441_c0_g1_i1.p1 TRINITY_DN1441_c0_g1~~TRINITY_DN1441_c0_g1_i1.p1  ORF type:complete len:221 (+),score=35.52 TRINITY_DN1441_c0_g1_i1:34-663(+)
MTQQDEDEYVLQEAEDFPDTYEEEILTDSGDDEYDVGEELHGDEYGADDEPHELSDCFPTAGAAWLQGTVVGAITGGLIRYFSAAEKQKLLLIAVTRRRHVIKGVFQYAIRFGGVMFVLHGIHCSLQCKRKKSDWINTALAGSTAGALFALTVLTPTPILLATQSAIFGAVWTALGYRQNFKYSPEAMAAIHKYKKLAANSHKTEDKNV